MGKRPSNAQHFKRTVTKFVLRLISKRPQILVIAICLFWPKHFIFVCVSIYSANHSSINSLAFYLNQLSVEPYCNYFLLLKLKVKSIDKSLYTLKSKSIITIHCTPFIITRSWILKPYIRTEISEKMSLKTNT